jgi:murein DD-endopeptidase MepM/ murein hydrolase activator NlpD
MLDYLKRFMIAGIVALCVSLLFFGGKPQAAVEEKAVEWIWPTDGTISDTFGTRFGHHKGIDIAGNINTPIFTVDDGTVSKSYYSNTYGHVVFIKHRNNLETVYAHLNNRMVEEGQSVKKGEIIGRMGNTGKSYGVHLHFEVHEDEWTYEKQNALNPTIVFGNIEVGRMVQAQVEDNTLYVVKDVSSEDLFSQESLETASTENTYMHKVKSGESLWAIAVKYNTSIDVIKSMNALDQTQIFVSQILKVPKVTVKEIYVVRKGDTLTAISQKTNQSIEEIITYNQLKTDVIYPDQKISIPLY